jgi:hypothetical protein
MKAKDIADILYRYFIQRKSLSLPGIGTFDLFQVSAQTDFANKKILPPGFTIVYNNQEDSPDHLLFSYIARKKNIPEWEAIKAVNDFSFSLRQRLLSGQSVSWDGIGDLKAGDGKQIQFEPERKVFQFIGQVHAHRVIREAESHGLLVGDRERTREEMTDMLQHGSAEYQVRGSWWNLAAILAAVAVFVIAIRAFTGGVSVTSGRQHSFTPAETSATYYFLKEPSR